MNRSMKYVVLAAYLGSIAACIGGGPTGPSPESRPRTLSGVVHETQPTDTTVVANARVEIADGPLAGRSATADAAGSYRIEGLSGNLNVRASQEGYEPNTRAADMTQNRTMNFGLRPVLRFIEDKLNGFVSGSDPPCSGVSDPCRGYPVPMHHTGSFDAALTWTERDTWLWLEVFGRNERIARSDLPREQLRQELHLNLNGGILYELRVRMVRGTRFTTFRLEKTHPN